METFGERLKELRTERGLSAKSLGKVLQIADSTIIRWENNKRGITNEYLVKLARYFDVSTDYLLGLEDEFGVKLR